MNPFSLMMFAWYMLGITLLVIFYPVLLIPFEKIWKKIKIKKETVKAFMSDGTMEREINLNYSPAFVSLLLDRKIEPVKDLVADTLNLIYKNVLKIEPETQKLIINYDKLKTTKISKEEKYIIKHIENYLNGSTFKFSFEMFEMSIKEEFVEAGFEIENKVKKYFKGLPKALMYGIRNWAVIILMPAIIWTIIYTSVYIIGNLSKIFKMDFILSFLFNITILPISVFIVIWICKWLGKRLGNVMRPPIILSEKGKIEYTKILKFKYFLEEYTLIEDKKVDSMVLFDWYIPYAIAIDTNKGYKKDIEEILEKINIEKIFLDVFKHELKKNYII